MGMGMGGGGSESESEFLVVSESESESGVWVSAAAAAGLMSATQGSATQGSASSATAEHESEGREEGARPLLVRVGTSGGSGFGACVRIPDPGVRYLTRRFVPSPERVINAATVFLHDVAEQMTSDEFLGVLFTECTVAIDVDPIKVKFCNLLHQCIAERPIGLDENRVGLRADIWRYTRGETVRTTGVLEARRSEQAPLCVEQAMAYINGHILLSMVAAEEGLRGALAEALPEEVTQLQVYEQILQIRGAGGTSALQPDLLKEVLYKDVAAILEKFAAGYKDVLLNGASVYSRAHALGLARRNG